MPDVQRTVATLQGLISTNGAGDISGQDLRDFLVSAAPDYGTLYVSSSGATTVSASATYYESAGTFTLAEAYQFTKGANNRLAYGGTPTREACVTIHGSITCASSTQALRVGIGKNGTVVSGAEVKLAYGTTGTDEIPFAITTILSLATTDYVGILVRNDTAANNVTVTFGAITATTWMK